MMLDGIDISNAPLVWRENNRGVGVRVVDPKWLKRARQREERRLKTLHEARLKQKQTPPREFPQPTAEWFERANTAADILLGARERKGRRVTYREIEFRICRAMGVNIHDVRGPWRNVHVTMARQAIAYWCRRRTLLSFPQIGQLMGGKDHTTIIHGVRRYPERRLGQGRYLAPLIAKQSKTKASNEGKH